jgi:hypothetical protein
MKREALFVHPMTQLDEKTVHLGVLDLLPGSETDPGMVFTFELPSGGPVGLSGATLAEERIEPSMPRFAPIVRRGRLPDVGGAARRAYARVSDAEWTSTAARLAWAAEGELRKAPSILRGIARDLRRLSLDRQVPLSSLAGTFVAGVVSVLVLNWIF